MWNILQDRSCVRPQNKSQIFKKTEISSIISDDNMKLVINYKKKLEETTNMLRLNSMLLNNQWVNEIIKEEIKEYLETNEIENTMSQNLWDRGKAVLRRKFSAVEAYLKK